MAPASARELLADDVRMLREHTEAPNEKLKELIDLNNDLHEYDYKPLHRSEEQEMQHVPAPDAFDDLPDDQRERHEAFVESYGRALFQIRNSVLRACRRRCESEEARASLPAIFRRPYDDLATLSPRDREIAQEGAKDVLDRFIYQMLSKLSHRGNDIEFGPMHFIRYRLEIEVYDLEREDEELVWSETVNRGGRRSFLRYWGRWLNRYGVPSSPPPAAQ